jgi:thiol-disulfide isomerase/thioredoxin
VAAADGGGGSAGDEALSPYRSTPEAIPPPAEFGQVVQRRPANFTSGGGGGGVGELLLSSPPQLSPSATEGRRESESSGAPSIESIRRRNVATAIAAVLLAVLNYGYQFLNPSNNPAQLLAQMQASSSDLSIIGSNGRPTLVDFWAPWCENCRTEAATLRQVRDEYAGRVNFVMVNGDDPSPRAWLAIDAFGVDAVPHMALVSPEGEVETALIGIVPRHVIEADLDALLLPPPSGRGAADGASAGVSSSSSSKVPLPYTMLDAFASRPEQRKLHFDPPQ